MRCNFRIQIQFAKIQTLHGMDNSICDLYRFLSSEFRRASRCIPGLHNYEFKYHCFLKSVYRHLLISTILPLSIRQTIVSDLVVVNCTRPKKTIGPHFSIRHTIVRAAFRESCPNPFGITNIWDFIKAIQLSSKQLYVALIVVSKRDVVPAERPAFQFTN